MATETPTGYPCGKDLDVDCPQGECPTYPRVKAFYEDLAKRYDMPVDRLIMMLRAQPGALKALFAASSDADGAVTPNQCIKSETPRTVVRLVKPIDLNRGKF